MSEMSKSKADAVASGDPGEAEGRSKPPMPFNSKVEWPYYWIARVNARYGIEMEKLLKPNGLDVSRWRVLSSLSEHGSLGVSDISEYCVLKLNTTTKIVQRMTAEGLVTTQPSRADARVTEVTLTRKGEAAARSASRSAQQVFERTLSDFSADEILLLNGLLQRVFDKLE